MVDVKIYAGSVQEYFVYKMVYQRREACLWSNEDKSPYWKPLSHSAWATSVSGMPVMGSHSAAIYMMVLRIEESMREMDSPTDM